MLWIRRMPLSAALAMLLLASNAHTQTIPNLTPIYEVRSTGLLAFSSEDRAIRVAAVFAKQDDATVDTVVNFLDAKGVLLKQQRADLKQGEPFVAELSRQDVAGRGNLLIRVEVMHKLPGERSKPYPILVTVQPIALGGSGRFALDWGGGGCGCPRCGPPTGSGQHAYCTPDYPIGF